LVNPFLILQFIEFMGDSLTELFESRKVPKIRELATLPWFNGLNAAIIFLQKDAFIIWLIGEG